MNHSSMRASDPDLVFGIVSTLGSNREGVHSALRRNLHAARYQVQNIHLSHLLEAREISKALVTQTHRMNSGDILRSVLSQGSSVALHGVVEIMRRRSKIRREGKCSRGVAWVLDSLVHPKEIELLRGIYGSRFFAIGCDSPWIQRFDNLTGRFRTESALNTTDAETEAAKAMHRHAGDPLPEKLKAIKKINDKYRLNVADCLQECDLFVRSDDPEKTDLVITRLIESIFSHPFRTPTIDELDMAVAFQASLMTATLARRVGAAIMVDEQIVSFGCNEVPKAGGGTYHAESKPDRREFVSGRDPSDPIRVHILADILHKLQQADWLAKKYGEFEYHHLAEEAMKDRSILGSEIFDVIEYGRSVHAEMAAITGAARIGVKIGGGTLYTTTLPCHECTRNILASGLSRVVYLEPYAKSRGHELQSHAVQLVARNNGPRHGVAFEPFSGISYKRFPDVFSWVDRKDQDRLPRSGKPAGGGAGSVRRRGVAVDWEAGTSRIRESLFDPSFDSAEILTQLYREYMVSAELVRRIHGDSDKLDSLVRKAIGGKLLQVLKEGEKFRSAIKSSKPPKPLKDRERRIYKKVVVKALL